MQIKRQIDAILNNKMDRTEFIKQIAIAIAALSGAGAAPKLLARNQTSSQVVGSGGSTYGGRAGGSR